MKGNWIIKFRVSSFNYYFVVHSLITLGGKKTEICEIIKTLRMNEILEEMCLGLGKRKAVARR